MINKPDKLIKEDLKQSSDRELLEFQCFLQNKQTEYLQNQLNSQKNIETKINFFYKLVVIHIIITIFALIFIVVADYRKQKRSEYKSLSGLELPIN
jgi:heme/copper-type cytochrome/quinol oxidase subunit 2